MKRVLFFHLLVVSLAFAKQDFVEFQNINSRVLAQVQNYRKIPRKNKKSSFKKYQSIRSTKYKGYKVTQIPQYEIPPLLTREDLNKIIPSHVSAKDPSSVVLRKMGDKAIGVWLKSSSMQKMTIVQAAQKVEQAMKAEINLAPEDSEIKHKLNFQVEAFQATSKVDYTGFVDASVSYNMRDQKAGYEVRRKVLRNKDLFVNHSETKNENLSSVGLKWSF